MNLLEGMLATLVFCGSASASLQIWGLAAVATARHDQRRSLMDRLDAELLQTDRRLRREAAAILPTQDCGAAADALVARAATLPLPGGLQRQVVRADRWVVLSVGTVGGDPPRRRLYSPSALNLCGEANGGAPGGQP